MPANPWRADSWNVTAQMAFYKQYGPDAAAQMAAAAGTTVGGKRPGGGSVAGGPGDPNAGPKRQVIILKKFYPAPPNANAGSGLSTVPSVRPALGFNETVKLSRILPLPPASPAIGLNAALTRLWLERHINGVANALGVSESVVLTRTLQLAAHPQLGANMAAALSETFVGTSVIAHPLLGVSVTNALLQMAFTIGANPALGASMAASLTRVKSLGTVAPALGFTATATINSFSSAHFDQGRPWEQQILFNANTATTLTMNSLGTDASPATAVQAVAAVVTKDFIYQIGGNNGTPTWTNTIYAAPINSGGTLGTWAAAGTIPVATSRAKIIMTKNRLVLIGGQINNGADAFTANCYSCPINSDGTLGAWVAEPSLITSRGGHSVLVNHPYVYVFGGLHGGTSSTISSCERALINNDGTLGAWASTTALPGGLSDAVLFDTGSRVYLITGYNGTITTTAMYAVKNSDGTLGAWTTTGATAPREAFFAAGFCTENRAFFFGGLGAGFAAVATAYSAPITSGVIGSWSAITALPNARNAMSVALTNSGVYLIGAQGGTACVTHAAFTGGLNDYTASSFH